MNHTLHPHQDHPIKEALDLLHTPRTVGKKVLGVICVTASIFLFATLLFFSWQPSTSSLISPLATLQVESAMLVNNFLAEKKSYPPSKYFPLTTNPHYEYVDDNISAISYAAMDKDTRELLIAKNLELRRPIASLTKVMTALVALENSQLTHEFIVTDEATKAGEASMGLSGGERVTLEELLYGLLLPSGNDASESVAEGVFLKEAVGGMVGDVLAESKEVGQTARVKSRVTFVAKMNAKAQELGMSNTRYVNPTGLDEESPSTSTYSTALDLLALGSYALDNPTIAKIVGTKFMALPYRANYHKAFYLSNILGLRQSYPGVSGIKPGNTDFAKETLMSYAENGGKHLVLVILGSDRTKDDAVKLYDFLYQKLGVKVKKKI